MSRATRLASSFIDTAAGYGWDDVTSSSPSSRGHQEVRLMVYIHRILRALMVMRFPIGPIPHLRVVSTMGEHYDAMLIVLHYQG